MSGQAVRAPSGTIARRRLTIARADCRCPTRSRWGSWGAAAGLGICSPESIKVPALAIIGERYCGTALTLRTRSLEGRDPQSCKSASLSPTSMGGYAQMVQL